MIYIVLILLLFIISDKKILRQDKTQSVQKKRKFFCIISSVIYILVISLRCLATGKDTFQYQYIFNDLSEYKSFAESLNYYNIEYGYALWQWVLHNFTDYRGFLFFQAVIMILPFSYVVYKRSENVVVSMVLYILLSFLTWDMCAARQAPAVSFTFLAYYFYSERKMNKALLTYLLALSFHITALIVLPAVLFLKLIKSDKLLLILIITSKLLGTVFLHVILPYMRIDYSDSVLDESVGQLTYMGFLMIFLLLLWVKRKYKVFLNDEFYLFSVMLILWPMVDTISAAFRITFYFLIYLTLCIPFVFRQLNSRIRLDVRVIKISIFLICFLYFYNQHYGNRSRCVYPYYSVFEYGDDMVIPKLYENQ